MSLKLMIKFFLQSQSKDLQDLAVLSIFGRLTESKLEMPSATFMELGADDGIRKSNCYLLEKQGWQGIAVEANPHRSQSLSLNRRCIIILAAVHPDDGETVLRIVKKQPSASYIRDFGCAYTSLTSNSDEIFDVRVSTISPEKLMNIFVAEFGESPFYYSSDIEGMDTLILIQFLELGFRPSVISIEHNQDSHNLDLITQVSLIYGYQEFMPGFFRNDMFLVRKDLFLLESYR
jgi:hypothetical protein